jgi:ceramide glucosyltransferase
MIKLRSFSDAVGFGSATGHGGVQWSVALGWIGLIWYSTVTAVCALGYYKMYVLCYFSMVLGEFDIIHPGVYANSLS